MMPSGRVRRATVADMRVIEAWLPTDHSVGTLAMNWDVTMDVFNEGRVAVWEEAASGKPVAYCWGSLNSHSSVLEVQPEYRGLGIGRAMAEYMIESSLADRDPLLEIHISPESAEAFWQGMGFVTYIKRGRCYGRRILDLPQVAVTGTSRSVTVRFFPASAMWANPQALACHEIKGIEVTGGEIVLEHAVSQFDSPDDSDLVVEILVDGKSRYKDKAKYERAQAIGVVQCRRGFTIWRILPDHE